jgi:hypothetical protein
LLRVLLIRAALVATPFVIWFVWREWARRNGRAMGETPWAWLVAAAAVLVAASMLILPLFHDEEADGRYVPAQTLPDGRVVPGHYEPKPSSKTP